MIQGLALFVLFCCVSAAVATPLPIQFASDESQSTTVTVTVRNPSATDTLVVVPYSSPLLADSRRSFEVVDLETNEVLEYTGASFKRLWPPSSDSLISIGAGEAHSVSVDLTQAFSFTAGRSYSVQLNPAASMLAMYLPTDEHQKRTASSLVDLFSSSALRLTFASPLRAEPTLVRPSASTTPYGLSRAARSTDDNGSTCSTDQNNFITTAVTMSRELIATAQQYVDASCKTSDYTTWFGIVSSGRYTTVSNCVSNVNELLSSAYEVNYRVACGGDKCTSDTYAYVYPADTAAPKIIHGCAVFFQSSQEIGDLDTSGGTLIHESSHFDDICATDDHEYGTTACQALAISSPSQAVNNADSYEYFSESLPTLCSTVTTNTATSQSGSSTSTRTTTDDTTSSSSSSGCFATSSHIRVLDNGAEVIKSLADVRVGDLVESVDHDLNRVFSEVYAVLHKDSATVVDVLQLSFEGLASSLKLTPHHLLLSAASELIAAASVKVGDQLLFVVDDDAKTVIGRRVVSIEQLKEAIRAPLTLNDRIVVDGVVASVYAHSETVYAPLCAPLKFFHVHFPHLFASAVVQTVLDFVVRLTDSFEARHAVVLASF